MIADQNVLAHGRSNVVDKRPGVPPHDDHDEDRSNDRIDEAEIIPDEPAFGGGGAGRLEIETGMMAMQAEITKLVDVLRQVADMNGPIHVAEQCR